MKSKTHQNNPKHQGLILLVVLGMLALFSLLAVSYMVVSSQSRASSAGMARRDYRGTPGPKLLDSAMRVALRGTTDPGSALWHADLLGDVYGSNEDPIQLRVRRFQWAGPPPAAGNLYPALSHGNIERPMLLAGRFLRIPIVLNGMPFNNEMPGALPPNTDVWTNRIATFLSGPLRGESFPVIRYIGDTTGAGSPITAAQNHSIVIDLQDVQDRLISVGGITMSTSDWINAMPAGGTNLEKHGLWLCYPDVPVNGAPGAQFSTGYSIQLNAVPYNSHGIGIDSDRTSATLSQTHTFPPPFPPTAPPLATTGLGTFPVALQPHYGLLGVTLVGDTDESYDAADFNNPWLSHRESGATDSTGIIPSFHQAALVNYIANWKDPMTYASLAELEATVLRIERAVARPLSYRVRDANGVVLLGANIDFTGSNRGNYAAGLTPQLDVRWTTATNWPTDPQGAPAFLDWLRWLTSGPWDVDSDADSIMDGVWVDANLPLITSREGKLLKTLVSYTIESLDSRLDLNAVGNLTQLNSLYGGASYALPTNNAFTVGAGVNLPQGIGFGPAEISMRHLLGNDATYTNLLVSRYSNGSENLPGGIGNDLRGQLDARERRNVVDHSNLPSLPMAVHGRIGMGIDLMGNPRLINTSVLSAYGNAFNQGMNDAYESRLMFGSHQDNPFSISEWERFYRPNDWDRSSLPRRLNATFANRFAVTPLSRHNRSMDMQVSRTLGNQSNSMFSLLQAIYTYKAPPPPSDATLNFTAFLQLFPIEFHRAQGLNLNRALGNGVDDDGDGNIDEPEEMLQNGIDDDGNGTVDEMTASERNPLAFRQRSYTAISGSNAFPSNVAEDYTLGQGIFPGGNLDPSYESLATAPPLGADYATRSYHFGQQSRQLLARNLYCLAMLVLPNDLYPSNRASTAPVTGSARARMLAQWAVNAVDFRDADSAMTRFPYDPEPFDNAGGSEPYWFPDVAAGEVVWGNEQVDLVLTESLFTHDLRVKDTSKDDNGGDTLPMDNDYDQYRIPEGSGFFELLCVRTTSTLTDSDTPGVSPSLYGTFGGSKLLNVSAVTPPDASGDVFPVYRIAISAPHSTSTDTPLKLQDPMHPSGPTARANITYQLSSNPDLNGLGWDASSPAAARPPEFDIDRVVLFTVPGAVPISLSTIPDMPAGVTNLDLPGRVFDNRSGGSVVLGGGQYLVVGPRQVTYFGSRDLGPSSTNHRPNHHRIVLEDAVGTASGSTGNSNPPYANWATLFDAANDRVTNKRTAVRDCVAMIAATDPYWNPNPAGGLPPIVDSIGLNVSAPHADQYYLAPREYLDNSDTMADPVNNAPGYKNMRADAYYDFSGGMSLNLPDEPFDGRPAPQYPLGTGAANWTAGHNEGVPNPGTQEDWCTAFLQRLADPERPWHAAFNPYITTDWIPIDLTVFSGEANIPPPPPPANQFRFMSRQKAGSMANIASGGYALAGPKTFLSYETTELYDSPTGTATGVYFDRELPMDELDASSNILTPRPTSNAGLNHYSSLGYLNSTFELRGEPTPAPGGVAAGFVGVPSVPPSALYWPDRPFANPYELMAVPLSAPGQLFQEFSAPLSTSPGMMYSASTAPNEFGHLPNFVQPLSAPTGQLAAVSMLELMETPSPWSDAEDFVNPATIDAAPYGANALQDAINEIFPTLRAPYNRISKFVEPGKVNINDISEPGVWQGIMWNAMTPSTRNSVQAEAAIPYWIALRNSRRGYTIPTSTSVIPAGNTNLNAEFPTQFAGVFKSSFAAGFVPSTRGSVLDAVAVSNPAYVTLLRANLTSPPTPLFATTNVTATKHPFSEYLPTTRLANLTTQRSNAFAVRVTIGFFEYNSSTGLGAEYGDEEGELRRHSAIYVIDRSIPVGYQQGQDLNTDKCILLRRVIE